MSTVYNYKYTIIKQSGAEMSVTINAIHPTQADLKAKSIARLMKGKVGGSEKTKVPYKTKDEKLNKLLEAMTSY